MRVSKFLPGYVSFTCPTVAIVPYHMTELTMNLVLLNFRFVQCHTYSPHCHTFVATVCRSGADKISIGSDSVLIAEDWVSSGGKLTGDSSIEQISAVYGKQVGHATNTLSSSSTSVGNC